MFLNLAYGDQIKEKLSWAIWHTSIIHRHGNKLKVSMVYASNLRQARPMKQNPISNNQWRKRLGKN